MNILEHQKKRKSVKMISHFYKHIQVFSIQKAVKKAWSVKLFVSPFVKNSCMNISDPDLVNYQENFARWEPGHGRFRFRHPWKQYLKIGTLTRQCAYRIEALNSYLNSGNQVFYHFIYKHNLFPTSRTCSQHVRIELPGQLGQIS